MSRVGCSQDQAIAILKNRSQCTNRKLRIIADEVIRIGDLKPAPTDKEGNRLGDAETRRIRSITSHFDAPPRHPRHRGQQKHGHRLTLRSRLIQTRCNPQTAGHGQSRRLLQAGPIRRNGQAGQSERILRPLPDHHDGHRGRLGQLPVSRGQPWNSCHDSRPAIIRRRIDTPTRRLNRPGWNLPAAGFQMAGVVRYWLASTSAGDLPAMAVRRLLD
jgi:hypothetical protein